MVQDMDEAERQFCGAAVIDTSFAGAEILLRLRLRKMK
jgi:hypothetical protein